MNLNELRDRAYKCACEHGFHFTYYPYQHWLVQVVCELSEAIEADRKGKIANKDEFLKNLQMCRITESSVEENPVIWIMEFEDEIKDSVEDEFADAFIRLLDYSGLMCFDLSDLDSLWGLSVHELHLKNKYSWLQKECLTVVVYELEKYVIGCEDKGYKVSATLELLLIYCKIRGIDLEWHIEQKMRYNELRPHLNGKKY